MSTHQQIVGSTTFRKKHFLHFVRFYNFVNKDNNTSRSYVV
jgi:hypothetical protein